MLPYVAHRYLLVVFPGSSTYLAQWTVQSTAIDDTAIVNSFPPEVLEVLRSQPQPHQQPATIPPQMSHAHPPPPAFQYPQQLPNGHHPAPSMPHSPFAGSVPVPVNRIAELPARITASPAPQAAVGQQSVPAFVDPAILSYDTSSPVQRRRTSKPAGLETPIKSMLTRAAANLPSPSSPFIGDITKANVAQKMAAAKQAGAAQQQPPVPVASKPSVEAALGDDVQNPVVENGGKKKVRRGQKVKKQPPDAGQDPPPVMNAEVSRNGNDMNGQVKRGKGWRSTPLLQPSPSAGPSLDQANTKKSRRKHKGELEQEFAQGDTTDIQDMGDFDFDAGLKKFDKKQVFDEIRQGDTTADEDRLVSHNKARPGTYGGKNLHPTENVLSPKLETKYNSNETDNTSDADTELGLGLANGSSSSKHSVSRKVFPKTRPSRQNSAQVDSLPRPPPHLLAASLSSDRVRDRSTTSRVSRGKQATSLATSSPKPDRANSPSAISVTKTAIQGSAKNQDPHFAISSHMSTCPTLLPKALENLEAATVSTFSLSQEAIAENAARSVAETALHLSEAHKGLRRPSRTNTMRGSMTGSMTLNSPPESSTIVILAGNHDIGARALAAARHLLGRNVKIIAVESTFESAATQHPHVHAQRAILRKLAQAGAKVKRGAWHKCQKAIKNLTGPPVVIIDALLAGATFESLLEPNADFSALVQQETREMIDWANRSRAPVLSVGCPSGVSGVDGVSTIVEGEPLAVRPDRVLALGAPMSGLLKATEAGERWNISLADIGINIGLKVEDQVVFGESWSVNLKYVDEEAMS